METTRVFKELLKGYLDGCRYLDSCGGTRSTKTYSALQVLIILALKDKKPTITSIVSETLPHLKKGAIRDFKEIMANEGLWEEDRWHETDKIYTFANGSIIEFFSADTPGKVHGPGRDRLFLNEAQNVAWEVANQLFIRTRGVILIDYNPTHAFWVHSEIQPDPRTRTIRSTYKDNRFLTKDQIQDIENQKKNEGWWRVYGLGEVGVLEGVIYNFIQVDSLPDNPKYIDFYGLDYGFTNDPTAVVHIKADPRKKVAYLDEVIYQTHLHNSDIVKLLKQQGVQPRATIYADSAEPKANDEIKLAGFNVIGSYKGKDLKYQINMVQEWTIYVTKRSVNLIHESRNYIWATDKDGKPLNTPIDLYNHGMDAMRYGIFTKFGDFRTPVTGGKSKTRKQSDTWSN